MLLLVTEASHMFQRGVGNAMIASQSTVVCSGRWPHGCRDGVHSSDTFLIVRCMSCSDSGYRHIYIRHSVGFRQPRAVSSLSELLVDSLRTSTLPSSLAVHYGRLIHSDRMRCRGQDDANRSRRLLSCLAKSKATAEVIALRPVCLAVSPVQNSFCRALDGSESSRSFS